MRKSMKILSLVTVFVLLYGMAGVTTAYAADKKCLSFYPTGTRTVEAGKRDLFQVITSASEPPTVKSSDPTVLTVELDKIVGDATLKTYQYLYRGVKAGSATVTLNSKDGLSAKETFTVKKASVAASFQSDTTGNVSLKSGATYCVKITSFQKNGKVVKPEFSFSAKNVLQEVSVKQSGNCFYYKVKAVGKAGQSAELYTSASGIQKTKQCKFTVTEAQKSQPTAVKAAKVTCDTSGEFGIPQDSSYSFKLTAPTGIAPNFILGTENIFASEFVRKSGNDYYYKITAIGKPGQSVGVYIAAPGEKPVRQCKVFIKER